jgi:hypothetical protein
VKVVVFGQIQEAFNCSGGYLALDAKLRGVREVMLGNMKNRFNEETNGGKSRGVVMIYFSCEPGRMYGVVLIFFYGW